MAFKQYVLMEHMLPSNKNIHVRVNKQQRQAQDKLPTYRPYLQVTYTDKDGKNVTIRYKANANSIFLDQQIKDGIPANAKFTTQDYRDPEFTNNVLSTDNVNLQNYLEAYPGYNKFTGKSNSVPRHEYMLVDKLADTKDLNKTIKRRLEAGARIFKLKLEETKDLLYAIYGTAYVPSEEVELNHAALINFLDETDEAIDIILKADYSVDDEVKILIGRMTTMELLSFDIIPNQVAKKIAGEWKDIKFISNDYSSEERVRLFSEFLLTDAGELLYNDLKADLESAEKEIVDAAKAKK